MKLIKFSSRGNPCYINPDSVDYLYVPLAESLKDNPGTYIVVRSTSADEFGVYTDEDIHQVAQKLTKEDNL